MRDEFFICDCYSDEHILRFSYDPSDKEFPELYWSIFLRSKSFWFRLNEGIKYILGHTSKYGHFDTGIVAFKDLERLETLVHNFRQLFVDNTKNI